MPGADVHAARAEPSLSGDPCQQMDAIDDIAQCLVSNLSASLDEALSTYRPHLIRLRERDIGEATLRRLDAEVKGDPSGFRDGNHDGELAGTPP